MEGNSTELAIEQSYHYKSRALISNLNGSSQTPPILSILGLELFDFLNGFMGFISVAKVMEENFCARYSQQRQSKCIHLHKQELGTGRSLFDDKTQNLPFFPFLLTYMTLPTLLIVVVGT